MICREVSVNSPGNPGEEKEGYGGKDWHDRMTPCTCPGKRNVTMQIHCEKANKKPDDLKLPHGTTAENNEQSSRRDETHNISCVMYSIIIFIIKNSKIIKKVMLRSITLTFRRCDVGNITVLTIGAVFTY